MLLLIALALMTGAAVLAVLWPLSLDRTLRDPAGDAVALYRQQLREIDRDVARGLLPTAEAEAARAETGRRLVRADAEADARIAEAGEPALRRRRASSAIALSVVPIVAIAIYGALGSPHLNGATRPALQAQAPDLNEAVARIEAHLRLQPDDGRGWEIIAPVYLGQGRYSDAVGAYRAAVRLLGEEPTRLTALGEALVAAADGTVSSDAQAAFSRALALRPSDVKGRFYTALAAEQNGDRTGARDALAALLAEAGPDAPWRPLVADRLARLDGGPSDRPTAIAGEVPAEIAAMVDGLDRRLGSGGGTEPEWTRLIRSYVVLGQGDVARQRLDRARTALAGDPAVAGRLDQLARDLGIAGRVSP